MARKNPKIPARIARLGFDLVVVDRTTGREIGRMTLRERVQANPGRVRSNPARGLTKKGNAIQSLEFARSKGWTKTNAQEWATSHGFAAPNTAIEITESEVRIRQMDPGRFSSFSSFDLSKGQGIRATYGIGARKRDKK